MKVFAKQTHIGRRLVGTVFIVLLAIMLGIPRVGVVGTAQAAATLTASPSRVVPNEVIALTGAGFTANEHISFFWDNVTLGKVIVAAANGTFSNVKETAPFTAGVGTHAIIARGTAGQAATVIVTIPAPTLSVSSLTVVPRQSVTVSGAGLGARETVLVYWNNVILPGTASTNAEGAFSRPVIVPVQTSTGTASLKAVGQKSGRVVQLAVTVKGTSPAPTATAHRGAPTATPIPAAPAITVSPMVVVPQGRFDISGRGFGANETVIFLWDGTAALGSAATNAAGSFSGAVEVAPANAAGGTHLFIVEGQATHRRAQVNMLVSVSAPAPTSTAVAASGPALPTGVYHFTGSLVASPGAQVSHVAGILSLQVAADGSLNGSTLRLTSGATVPVGGSGARGLLAFDAEGLHLDGHSTAVSGNRLSGLFTNSAGGTDGFWVATRIAQGQAGTHYNFTGHIASGPDSGMTYAGTLELWGDSYGGLLGWLTLGGNTVLNLNGQSVNGNVNMLIVVRSGTPMFASGTTISGGNLQGTIAGPLAGDQGTWTATK